MSYLSLLINKSRDHHLMRLEPNADHKLWQVKIGLWWQGRNDKTEFESKEPVLVDSGDLLQLASEIETLIERKPGEDVELALSFRENRPDFKAFLKYLTPADPFYDEFLEGKFRLSLGFNSNYAGSHYLTHSPDEPQKFSAGLIIGGELFQFLREYFTAEELLSFVQEIRDQVQTIG